MPNSSPDTRPWSVPTRTATTTAATSTSTLSSTPCGWPRWSASPTWTGPATPRPGRSTAAPPLLCTTSGPRSWSCARRRGCTRSTCWVGAGAVSPNGSIGRRRKGSLLWTRTMPPRGSRPPSLKRTRRSCAGRSGPSSTWPSASRILPSGCCSGASLSRRAGDGCLTSPPTGPSPSPPGNWGTSLTAPPSVPPWNATPPVPAWGPSPASGSSYTSPRASSAWWTSRPRKPRVRALATSVGRPTSI